jgi:serine phosphatase RsbU (regulator of sigma subunit)
MVQLKTQKSEKEVAAIKAEVDAINNLARKERVTLPQKTFEAVSKSYDLALSIDYKLGMGFALLNKSFYLFYIKADLAQGYHNLAIAEDLFLAINSIEGLAWVYNIQGSLFVQTGEYEKAFTVYSKAVEGFKQVQEEEGENLAIYLLGNLYLELKDYKNANLHHERSYYLAEKKQDQNMIANTLTSLGNVYHGLNELDKATTALYKAIQIAVVAQNANTEARAWNDLALVYSTKGDFEKAITYTQKSLAQREEYGNKQGIISALLNLGSLYGKLNKQEEAIALLQKAINIGDSINAKPKTMRAYQELASIYKAIDQPWQALEAYEKYMEIKAAAMGEETASQLRNANAMHEAEKLRKEAEITRIRNVELKAAYEEIEGKNQHIIDSIRYAKRIQEAILDPIDNITKLLGDAFIFYQAKDIVSGDFYWYGEVEAEEDEKKYKIIIAADCTGHGVPGAFMTVMGNDFLNDIILTRQVVNPSEILYKLDEKVTYTLNKQGNTIANDGMDIAILTIDEKEQTAYFAGAKNPLYLIRNGEILEIKGSKFPIGSTQYQTAKIYETSKLPMQPNDMLYIFTDGYQDQFGQQGKYMKRRFREFLHKIHTQPTQEQRINIEKEIKNWQTDKVQTDDWLVIGVKI